MAIGNVLGSNVFNLLAVLPFPAFLAPGELDPGLFERDYAVMGGLTVLLLLFSVGPRARINRVEGAVFLLVFASYLGLLVMSAMGKIAI
jgi:cation:H+ antiporter